MRIKALILTFLAVAPNLAAAITEAERETLARMAGEFQVLERMAKEAERRRNPDDRIQINYKQLLRELRTLRRGVRDAVEGEVFEPRHYEPVQGDYLR